MRRADISTKLTQIAESGRGDDSVYLLSDAIIAMNNDLLHSY